MSSRPGPRRRSSVEGTYTFPAVYQYAMETHATIAHYHGDGVTLWANCQHPFLVQAEIADLFGLEIGSVRIVVPYLGGGFGSKSYTKMEPLTVALARKAGRPVRIVNRVDESMVTSRRHGMRCWMRTTAAADGTLRSREVDFWMDTGAYADNGPRVTATAATRRPAPTAGTPSASTASCVYCNTPPSGSYRAFGATHLQWIGESQLDEVARRARHRPARAAPAQPRPAGRAGPPGRDRQAARRGPRRRRRARRRAPSAGRSRDGRGSGAASASGCSPPAPTRSRARRCASARTARPTCTSARPRSARGPRTVMAQIAAEELGAPERARARPRRRHPLHPLRPLDRRQPLDDGRRARGQARRGERGGRAAARDGGRAVGRRPRGSSTSPTATPSSPARRSRSPT